MALYTLLSQIGPMFHTHLPSARQLAQNSSNSLSCSATLTRGLLRPQDLANRPPYPPIGHPCQRCVHVAQGLNTPAADNSVMTAAQLAIGQHNFFFILKNYFDHKLRLKLNLLIPNEEVQAVSVSNLVTWYLVFLTCSLVQGRGNNSGLVQILFSHRMLI